MDFKVVEEILEVMEKEEIVIQMEIKMEEGISKMVVKGVVLIVDKGVILQNSVLNVLYILIKERKGRSDFRGRGRGGYSRGS